MVKYADSCTGSYDGKVLTKPITDHDEQTITTSVEEAQQVLEKMGIRRD